MRFIYRSFYFFVAYLSLFSGSSYGQKVFFKGQIELVDGTIRTGELAYHQRKSISVVVFRDDKNASSTRFKPNDIRSFEILANRYVSRRLDDNPNSAVVFMRQLVSGPVNLLLYERSDSRNVYLLEQQGKLIPINAKYPVTTLSQLPECAGLERTLSNNESSVGGKKLAHYIIDYNHCIKPDVPAQAYGTSPRFLKISIGPRAFLPMSYYRIKFNDGLLYPASTPSSKPGLGLSINIRSRGRLGAGLDLALLSRKGRWITDSAAFVVKLAEKSLYINPFLRYEFRHHSSQVLTPYLTAGILFNKILNGQVTINPIYDYEGSPQPVAINKEAGIDEIGGSLGGGVLWQITHSLTFVADARFMYTVAALSVFEIPPVNGSARPGPRFTPRSYLLNCSVGLNFNL